MPKIRFGYTPVGCHMAIRLKCCLTEDNKKAMQNQFSEICIYPAKKDGEFIIEGCLLKSAFEKEFENALLVAKLKTSIEILNKRLKNAEAFSGSRNILNKYF
tara:strand:+ start:860 stop:1165 length:306 start_codon:yes stop_codon:yes gene_type:complete